MFGYLLPLELQGRNVGNNPAAIEKLFNGLWGSTGNGVPQAKVQTDTFNPHTDLVQTSRKFSTISHLSFAASPPASLFLKHVYLWLSKSCLSRPISVQPLTRGETLACDWTGGAVSWALPDPPELGPVVVAIDDVVKDFQHQLPELTVLHQRDGEEWVQEGRGQGSGHGLRLEAGRHLGHREEGEVLPHRGDRPPPAAMTQI